MIRRDRKADERRKEVTLDRNRDDIRQQTERPFHLTVHRQPPSQGYIIEVRPTSESWTPFVAAVPLADNLRVNLRIMHGEPGAPPTSGELKGAGQGFTDDWIFHFAENEATPEKSYYLYCAEMPSRLLFGANKGEQYMVEWSQPL